MLQRIGLYSDKRQIINPINFKEMRKVLMILMALSALDISAQDLIVTDDGESLKAYNVEVSSSAVFYQLSEGADAEILRMPKEKVLIIRKADGSRVDPNSVANTSQSSKQELPPASLRPTPAHKRETATICS